jgi:hypothetical protein
LIRGIGSSEKRGCEHAMTRRRKENVRGNYWCLTAIDFDRLRSALARRGSPEAIMYAVDVLE